MLVCPLHTSPVNECLRLRLHARRNNNIRERPRHSLQYTCMSVNSLKHTRATPGATVCSTVFDRLLEVNSSPSMEHSTPITTELCAAVAEDTLKVVVDAPAERERRMAAGDSAAEADARGYDTGRWSLIHRAAAQVKCPTYTGIDLAVVGCGEEKLARPPAHARQDSVRRGAPRVARRRHQARRGPEARRGARGRHTGAGRRRRLSSSNVERGVPPPRRPAASRSAAASLAPSTVYLSIFLRRTEDAPSAERASPACTPPPGLPHARAAVR